MAAPSPAVLVGLRAPASAVQVTVFDDRVDVALKVTVAPTLTLAVAGETLTEGVAAPSGASHTPRPKVATRR